MISASFGLTETGSVRDRNEDAYLMDADSGLFAVADGLGGLPNGARASRLALDILHRECLQNPGIPLSTVVAGLNEECRKIGFDLDTSGFGTTLTAARLRRDKAAVELVHVGDSAAFLLSKGKVRQLTVEHTVAARMVATQFEEADEAIPAAAHHTLTQCIGQDLYIDPQVVELQIQTGERLFLFTDGVTKAVDPKVLEDGMALSESLERVCQALTFRIEIAGSPDNYTLVAIEF